MPCTLRTSVCGVGISWYAKEYLFHKQWDKNTKWYRWISSVFLSPQILEGTLIMANTHISLIGNVDEGFSRCSAWTLAIFLSEDTVFFSTYKCIKSYYLFIAPWQGSFVSDSCAGMGSSRLQVGVCFPVLLTQSTGAQEVLGRESWSSDRSRVM